MSLRPDETWHRLLLWTAGSPPSERMAALVLSEEGYEDIDPIHPLGGRDGGKDARVTKDGKPWIMAVHFPRGQQDFTTIKAKFIADFAGVAANGAEGMAFVSNQELRESERRELEEAVEGEVEIFHLERLTTILDRPHMGGVREQFLGIPAVQPAPLDPGERLEELERASMARCVNRWQAAGLSREVAAQLSADRSVGRADPALLPSASEPVVVWTAPMGSGKSIAAERFHQDAIEAAKADDQASVPVFLSATFALPYLEESVLSAGSEIGDARRRSANVVVDGLDELGFEGAEVLLRQARVLAGTWPGTRVLLVTRPMGGLREIEERREFPVLPAERAHELIELAAGREVRGGELFGLPDTVKSLIRQPLFALLTGGWMRENAGLPRAPVDLFAELGRRASSEVAVDEMQIRQLAVLSVRHDLGLVAPAEVSDFEDAEDLVASGLVERRDAGLQFTLPALAQWFAAEALLRDELDLERLLEEPRDLDLWRYPLALAIASGSSAQANELLLPLLERQPGFAFSLLDLISSNAVLGGATPPLWQEGGAQVRLALQAIVDALGPTGPFVATTDEDGRLVPLAVASDERHLTVATYVGNEERPDVFPLPADFNPFAAGFDWGRVRLAVCGPGSAWAWEWVRTGVRGELERLLKQRAFPVAVDSPLADEAVWGLANTLMGTPVLVTDLLPLDDLIAAIEEMLPDDDPEAEVTYAHMGGPSYDLRPALAYLSRRRDEGEEVLRAPLPVADRLDGGSWTGDFYSEERLVQTAEAIYRNAIVAYRQLVERWLPTLAPRLETYALLPARVVGFLGTGHGGEGFPGSIPYMAGYLEALPVDAESDVAIEIGDTTRPMETAVEIWEAQKAARPEQARWLTGTVGGMSLELGHTSAVADAVYQWLARDLKRLGLVGSMAGNANRGARTIWDDESA